MKNICNQFNNNISFYYTLKPLLILKKSNRNQIYVNINKNGIKKIIEKRKKERSKNNTKFISLCVSM